ncbi:MAG: dihydropteroate synthase [Solirubrobacteraceae bacterium]|nr:dihydropteroate synthase [Solirubrobacteraceae bacterium]
MSALRLRDHTLAWARGRPLLMGIVNAGPDSFSDAVRLSTLESRLAYARRLVADGADIIDVGGESGVTYTPASAPDVEIERVVPLVERLAAEGVAVSVDTWKPAVAAASVAAGAALINDTSGLRDMAMAELCARSGAGLLVMHTRAAPKEVRFADYGGDVAGDVVRFLAERRTAALAAGVPADRLVLDPGPDFAKTPAETVEVLRATDRLHDLGHPLLLAVSRKYFLGAITGRPPAERLASTLAAVGWAADAGAAIVRVHDVAEAADFLRVRRVLAGEEEVAPFDEDDEDLKWIRVRSTP